MEAKQKVDSQKEKKRRLAQQEIDDVLIKKRRIEADITALREVCVIT